MKIVIAIFFASLNLYAAEKKITCVQLIRSTKTSRNREQVFRNRFLNPLMRIKKIVDTGDLDSAIEKLDEFDLRRDVFKLEDLLRAQIKDGNGAAHNLAFIKEFEDLLGKYADRRKDVKHGKTAKVPPQIQNYLKRKLDTARTNFKEFLINSGWATETGRFADFVQYLSELEIPKQSDDTQAILDGLIKDVKEINEKEFDMRELQTGLHELRRRLRWILIKAQSLEGKIVIDPVSEPRPELRALLNDFDTSKVKLPESNDNIKHPIHIPSDIYSAISSLVTQFGDLKDHGEFFDTISNAYLAISDSRITERQADQLAGQTLGERPSRLDYLPQARALYKKFQESHVLDLFINSLKSQLN